MTTQRFDSDAFAPIDGCTLERYAAVCRALVRVPGGSIRQVDTALAEFGLTRDRWDRVRRGWSARIGSDPFVLSAFRRLYVGAVDADSRGPTT